MGGEQHEEFKGLMDYIKNNYELKTALFTGAEEVRDDIKSLLNYAKTGRYIESLGGLESSITNQKLVELRS
jgi:anaerobic ribonucleoside-triphosphate reductase activating protein